MNNQRTKFPLILGFFVLILSVLTVSIKIGERNIVSTGRISAGEDKVQLDIQYSPPDLMSINFSSSKEIIGADIVLTHDGKNFEILPSTLTGMVGYVAIGGEVEADSSRFSFSAVNPESTLKNGVLATFRIRANEKNVNLNEKIKLDFVPGETRIYAKNLELIPADFKGVN